MLEHGLEVGRIGTGCSDFVAIDARRVEHLTRYRNWIARRTVGAVTEYREAEVRQGDANLVQETRLRAYFE